MSKRSSPWLFISGILCWLGCSSLPTEAACTRAVGSSEASRFEFIEGEARDRLSGLVWRRCSIGLEWAAGKGCVGDRTALTLKEAIDKVAEAGRLWRLPTAQELVTLIDRDCERPATDTTAFPDVADDTGEGAEEYWSSSSGGIADMQATVEMYIGYKEIRSPGFQRRARLVRNATQDERKRR